MSMKVAKCQVPLVQVANLSPNPSITMIIILKAKQKNLTLQHKLTRSKTQFTILSLTITDTQKLTNQDPEHKTEN